MKTRKTKTGYDTRIEGGALYFGNRKQCDVDDYRFAEIISDEYTKAIRLVSLASDYSVNVNYFQTGATVKENIKIEMTLRREKRSGVYHWYAYRRVFGKLHKRYVGTAENISQHKLLQIARNMPG